MDSLHSLVTRLEAQTPTDPFYHQPTDLIPSGAKTPPYWTMNAAVDWCEQNYVHSRYVAETYNVLSSLGFVVAGLLGMWFCRKYRLESRISLSYFLMMIIGIGSSLFHGTLTWWGQSSDELPMIYASATFFYVIVEVNLVRKQKSWVFYLLLAYLVAFTVVYFAFPEFFPIFIFIYSCSVLIIIYQAYSVYRIYFKHDTTRAGLTQRRLFYVCAILYPCAFLFLWVPENFLCPYYPTLFHNLHLHAWFHVLTTISPVSCMAFTTYHRYKNVLKAEDVTHGFCAPLMFPYVRVVQAKSV